MIDKHVRKSIVSYANVLTKWQTNIKRFNRSNCQLSNSGALTPADSIVDGQFKSLSTTRANQKLIFTHIIIVTQHIFSSMAIFDYRQQVPQPPTHVARHCQRAAVCNFFSWLYIFVQHLHTVEISTWRQNAKFFYHQESEGAALFCTFSWICSINKCGLPHCAKNKTLL